MPLPSLRRFAATLFAAWFALVAADVPGLHTCAMHDAPTAGSAVAPAVGHGGHHAHAASAPAAHGHDSEPIAQPVTDTPSDGAPTDEGHRCLCIGACAGAQAAPISTPPTLRVTVVAMPTATRVRARTIAPPARVDLELPFATAPPMLG